LNQHRRDKHQIFQPRCHLCGRKFETQHALEQHLQSPRHNSTTRVNTRNSISSQSREQQKAFIREVLENARQFNNTHLSRDERRKKHFERNRTIIIDNTLKCPPHQFDIQIPTLVGFGPGNGGEQRKDVETIEKCVFCGRTRLDIEKSEKS
jgi:hypothetical protein